jgi:steroid delta-isomerase-like uncharacterized protein
MKKIILLFTKTTYLTVLILSLLCLTFCDGIIDHREGMSPKKARNLFERDIEVWNGGMMDMAYEFIAADYVEHTVGIPEDIVGVDAFKERITNLRTIYPDFNVTVEEYIKQSYTIVARWIVTGTNTCTINDIPPTGKKMRLEGLSILSLRENENGGVIVKRVLYYNEADMLKQLGYTIIPPTFESEE